MDVPGLARSGEGSRMEIRIYYEDTDCGGVVYYANYLRYFERARTEYLEKFGLSFRELMEMGVRFVVVHAEVDYMSPARYGDTLVIETSVVDVRRASVILHYEVLEKRTLTRVVTGQTTIVCVDSKGKVKPFGPEIRSKLRTAH